MKMKDHSCLPDHSQNEIDKHLYEMKQTACSSITPMKTVYEDHVIPLKDAGLDLISKIPSFVSVKTGLYNNRKKAATVSKIVYQSTCEVEVPPKFEKFVLGDYSYNENRIIAFCSKDAKDHIPKIHHYFGDGTFRSCPPPFVQLYTVHGDAGSSLETLNVVPLVYALMSDKKEASYTALFNMIKSQIPEFNPREFQTDYEAAAMNAIEIVFPQCIIKGCFYHYAKALWRKAKSLKITKAQSNKRIVALSTALPFLPYHLIMDGWSYILEDISEDLGMRNFKYYMERQWLHDIGFIKKWSIHGELHRTTNCLEGWHKKLNDQIGKRGPNLMTLLTTLQRDSEYVVIKLKGGLIEKRRKESRRRNDFIISTNVMLTHGMHVGFFLERVAWKASLFQ